MRKLMAVLLVVTACGQSAPPRARPVQEIDGTTAHAVAKAGALRKADLPGYTEFPVRQTDGAGTCLVQGPREVTGRVKGFQRGRAFVFGGVSIAPTRAAVDQYVTFLRDEFDDCFERALMAVLATVDISASGYRSKPVRVRVPGSDAAFAWDVRLTVYDETRKGALRTRVVTATTGYAAILVFAFGAPAEVPSVARLATLTSAATRRAGAAARRAKTGAA